MTKWSDIFGAADSPYEFPLGIEVGSEFQVPPPFPNAIIQSVTEMYMRRVIVQRIDLAASAEEQDRTENIRVLSVVLETEDGQQIELHRTAAPIEDLEASAVNRTTCESCGGHIPSGIARIYGRYAYHPQCIMEDDDGKSARIRNPVHLAAGDSVPGCAGAGDSDHIRKGVEKVVENETASTAEKRTATKINLSEDGEITHAVTIIEIDEDRYLLMLYSADNGGTAMSVIADSCGNMYQDGRSADVDVVDIGEKPLLCKGMANATDLQAWDILYRIAFEDLNTPATED